MRRSFPVIGYSNKEQQNERMIFVRTLKEDGLCSMRQSPTENIIPTYRWIIFEGGGQQFRNGNHNHHTTDQGEEDSIGCVGHCGC